MNALQIVSCAVGVLLVVPGAACLGLPSLSRALWKRFPRHVPAAWVLTAVDLAWAGWLLHQTPLGWFDPYKRLLVVLVPAAFVLVIVFMDELLAPRAFGGLLLLAPAPMLTAARWHPSAWRYVVTLTAYAFAVWGMVLVLSPYQFRRLGNVLIGSDAACRAWGGALTAFGLLLLLLGLAVY